jgi:hypothetical protein
MGWISAYRQKADHHQAHISVPLSSQSARSGLRDYFIRLDLPCCPTCTERFASRQIIASQIAAIGAKGRMSGGSTKWILGKIHNSSYTQIDSILPILPDMVIA